MPYHLPGGSCPLFRHSVFVEGALEVQETTAGIYVMIARASSYVRQTTLEEQKM